MVLLASSVHQTQTPTKTQEKSGHSLSEKPDLKYKKANLRKSQTPNIGPQISNMC